MRIIIVANEAAGIRVVRAVAKLPYEIVGVMTFGQKGEIGSVSEIATKLGLKTFPGDLVRDADFASIIIKEEVDLIINVHSQAIFCDEVLHAPKIGCFNLHPGPLPEYAGLNPVSWVIYNGELQYGVTVHRMVTKIDAGEIAYENRFKCEENETALSLMSKCVLKGVPLVLQLLVDCEKNPENIPRVKQSKSTGNYNGSEIPNEGKIDLSLTSNEISRFVRACDFGPYVSPWGHPFIVINKTRVHILSLDNTNKDALDAPGTIATNDKDELMIATADKWVILNKVLINNEIMTSSDIFKWNNNLLVMNVISNV